MLYIVLELKAMTKKSAGELFYFMLRRAQAVQFVQSVCTVNFLCSPVNNQAWDSLETENVTEYIIVKVANPPQ